MKKLLYPALFCAALMTATTSCSNNKAEQDVASTAEDNAQRNAVNGEVNASNDGDTTGMSDKTTDRTGPQGMNGNSGGDGTATMPHKDDNEFMMSAAHSDQNEMQLSKLVLAKGVSGVAKEHANMMITDHTKSTTMLKTIAQKKGVTLPTDMDAEHKTIAAEMEKLSGPELEQRFIAQMVLDHQKTMNTMQAHAKMTQDADVKGFIAKTTPVIQKHLDTSRKHGGPTAGSHM